MAVASLRITCSRLGATEVTTYRDEVRVKPVVLSEEDEAALRTRMPGATYHRTTATLNVQVARVAGAELPGRVEAALLSATGAELPSVSIAG
jgi:hypothetical protein